MIERDGEWWLAGDLNSGKISIKIADPVAEPGLGIEINADAEAGFTSRLFRDAVETPDPGGMGLTLRIKNPGRDEKQSLAQLDAAMSKFQKALFRYQRENNDEAWAPYIQQSNRVRQPEAAKVWPRYSRPEPGGD